jgi:hypothetical protein
VVRKKRLNQPASREGQKGLRGVPYNEYGEVKARVSITLTPTTLEALDTQALREGKSRSVYLEELLRRVFNLEA